MDYCTEMVVGGNTYHMKGESVGPLTNIIQIPEDYYRKNLLADLLIDNMTYNSETCAVSVTFPQGEDYQFINIQGLQQYHFYHVVVDGTVVRIGEREDTSHTWYKTHEFADFNKAEGTYYDRYFMENNGYLLTIEVKTTDTVQHMAIYDVTNVSWAIGDGLVTISPYIYWADKIGSINYSSLINFARAYGYYFAKNHVLDMFLEDFTYKPETGAFTASGEYLMNMRSLIKNHTYRIIVNGSVGTCGIRPGVSEAWTDAFGFESFTYDNGFWYRDYTPGYDNYFFTITMGDMTRFAIYDITWLSAEAKSNLKKIFTPYYCGQEKQTGGGGGGDDPGEMNITIVGDSQTQRGGYVSQLRNRITDGKSVSAYGQGGIDSKNMIAVQGGIGLYVKPFTIPATTTAVQIELFEDFGTGVGAMGLQSLAGLNPATIEGVEGTITVTYDAGYTNVKYYFTRSANGSQKVISRPALVHTGLMKNGRNNILVVWLGTNDSYGKTAADVEPLANDLYYNIMDAIQYNGTKQYIVMGLTAKSYMSSVADVNELLAQKFGGHFLDLRKYILAYGLSDAGITPTAQDTTDIANGEIPTSLRDDSVHFNTAGMTVIGNLLYKRGVEMGYWE